MLKTLGMKRGADLGWRDMWAVILAKGGTVYAEELSKSPGFNSWGAPVLLRTEIPLVPTEGIYRYFLHDFIVVFLFWSSIYSAMNT